jgi:hypothetical protein
MVSTPSAAAAAETRPAARAWSESISRMAAAHLFIFMIDRYLCLC